MLNMLKWNWIITTLYALKQASFYLYFVKLLKLQGFQLTVVIWCKHHIDTHCLEQSVPCCSFSWQLIELILLDPSPQTENNIKQVKQSNEILIKMCTINVRVKFHLQNIFFSQTYLSISVCRSFTGGVISWRACSTTHCNRRQQTARHLQWQ